MSSKLLVRSLIFCTTFLFCSLTGWAQCTETITADVVALDQVYTYNRFGAFNPVGMVYALRRDVVAIDPGQPIGPGNARLRDAKRPRPLTLRVNVGQCLEIKFTNYLAATRAQIPDPATEAAHVDVPAETEVHPGEPVSDLPGGRGDAPTTRTASIHINGLHPLDIADDGSNVGNNSSSLVAPGESRTYRFYADHEGTFFLQSMGAIAGGEGDGGSTVQGLFGAVNVEPAGSKWYRSQVTAAQLAAASRIDPTTGQPIKNPDGTPQIDYDAVDSNGVPILSIRNAAGEIVHADLNAIITDYRSTVAGTPSSVDERQFREFTVIFHDELKAVQAFEELDNSAAMHGVRDGFGINYGAAGLGAELLANRKKIGPTKDCIECKFEEFFLSSWAGGDPALNVEKDASGKATKALYADDPSNVSHSYVGDPVRFRNIHAGPKETHVFHLHAHQWLQSQGNDNSTYLDSQTIGPGSAFTYDINYGGSGNRNMTVGDSIYHCHLYPHFAQGMWALWRSHDVFEAGTPDRNLPDAEIAEGTPNPAVVPLPRRALPPMPTYVETPITASVATNSTISANTVTRSSKGAKTVKNTQSSRVARYSYTGGRVVRKEPSPVTDMPVLVPTNVALLATATASSENSATQQFALKAIDGIIGGFPGDHTVEWATVGEGKNAWLKLSWNAPQTINRVVLHDRVNDNEHILGGTLSFSDGSTVDVGSLPNNGSSGTYDFSTRTVEWVKFTITSTSILSGNIGLAEIEVWGGSGTAWTNRPPAITSGPTVSYLEVLGGQSTVISASISDPENRALTYTWSTSEGQLSTTQGVISSNGRISTTLVVPYVSADTTVTITLTVKDTENATVTDTAEVFVSPNNTTRNIASAAAVSASSETPHTSQTAAKAIDGVISGYPADASKEWVTQGGREGSWLKLSWTSPQTINRVVIYDRPNKLDWVVGGTLTFSDGSSVPVTSINNLGQATEISFATKTTTSLTFTVTEFSGINAGLAEMQVYSGTGDPTETGPVAKRPAMPGFPFYIGAVAGHRPSQAPYDIAHDGGLPRHIITSVPSAADAVTYGRRGEFDVEIHKANLKLLPQQGTTLEQAAINFHAGQFPGARRVTTRYGWPAAAYPAYTPEGKATLFMVNGQAPTAGAPYAEPCLPGSPQRTIRASVVQLDLVVNKAGWHDPQARIEVLDEDVAATLNGTRTPEPLFFRANSGDCITFYHTNLLPDVLQADDFQIFSPTDTVGQHIHLVKFDVTSSDGAGNGWNYEDGTFAAEEVRARIEAANALGGALAADGTIFEQGTRVHLAPKSHPTLTNAPLGAQTTVQRWWVDPLLNAAGKDRTIRTVFTHDHFGPSSHQQHGLYAALVVEPKGSVWRDPETGTTLGTRGDGGPTSYRADILLGNESFREFNLAFADFAIVYDAAGKPINPPTAKEAALPIAIEHPEGVVAPEVISAADPGTQLVNYRNEPIPLRIAEQVNGQPVQKAGDAGDMANVFRSDIHGDPFTPLLRGYVGDKIQIRLIQGAQEEQHVFALNGHTWLHQPSDEDSGYVAGQEFGLSEHFEVHLANGLPPVKNQKGTADYLYQSAATENLWDGIWGIMRTYSTRQLDLLPLPNSWDEQAMKEPATGPCPADVPQRNYKVHAITAKGNLPGDRLVYNEKFDLYDPDAILFVLEEELADLRAGRRRPEPLILRANAGECINVTLVNDLPLELPKTPHWNFNSPIVEKFNTNQVRPSNHVGLTPEVVQYDVNHSDGMNVGYNELQTVAPGQSRTYTWFAGEYTFGEGGLERKVIPMESGALNLRSNADVVNHGMHGAVGALIIEPEGSTWVLDPGTNASATVYYNHGDEHHHSTREFVLIYQDEVALHSNDPRFQDTDNLQSGTALRNIDGADDAEDSGHKAFNYRTEPLWARLGVAPQEADELNNHDLTNILSSRTHGDPATPIFTAQAGQEVRFRVLQPSGHARQHAFTLHGHSWLQQAWYTGSKSRVLGPNDKSAVISTQGGAAAKRAWNIAPLFGAGGKFAVSGDFLYRDQPSFMFSNGLWGVFRITP